MNIHLLNRIPSLVAGALIVSTAALPLELHARERSTTVRGPRGGVHQRHVERTPGNLSASASTT